MNRGSPVMSGRWCRVRSSFNEAPIHESGKSRSSWSVAATTGASMRPRFMNRGSGVTSSGMSGIRTCFNEAPIHESGKFRTNPVCSFSNFCFNEAPIHESGKSPKHPTTPHTPSVLQ